MNIVNFLLFRRLPSTDDLIRYLEDKGERKEFSRLAVPGFVMNLTKRDISLMVTNVMQPTSQKIPY